MEDFLQMLPVIGGIALFILCIICAVKESSITGKYAYYGMYGRVRAFFFFDFFFAGLFQIIGAFFPEMRDAGMGFWGAFGVGAVVFGLSLLIYFVTRAACPPFLRRGLFWSLCATGVGVTLKLAVFFIGVVWALQAPRQMEDSYGNTVYVQGGDVYNAAGDHIGTMTGSNTYKKDYKY